MSDTLKEERLAILELLKEGKINPDQAEALLSALGSSEPKQAPTPPTPPRESGKDQAFKVLRINVEGNGGEKVKVNIPLEFAKVLKKGKFGNFNLDEFDIDIDEILNMITLGAAEIGRASC